MCLFPGEHDLDVEEGPEQRIPVSSVTVHEAYDGATARGDLALLRLSEPVALSGHAVPVCLPTAHLATRELLQTRYHHISGWGLRTAAGSQDQDAGGASVLRRFTVPIIPMSQCSPSSAHANFSSGLICAGYADIPQPSCRGDDGSPLVTLYGSTHFLIGVVAWGRGCAAPGIYGVYTNMADYVEWVEGVMKAADMTQQTSI